MKKEVLEDGTIITGSEDVPTNLVVEPNRAQYRARIFGKRKIQKAPKFNRQNGRTPAQYEALKKINEFAREQIEQAKLTGKDPF